MSETYSGWTNRETWAFMLHVNNDQGMQEDTLRAVSEALAENPEMMDYELGDSATSHWRDAIDNWSEIYGGPLPEAMRMFDREVGSWWRLDLDEIGRALREDLCACGDADVHENKRPCPYHSEAGL